MIYQLSYAFKIWITTAWAAALYFPIYLLIGPDGTTSDLRSIIVIYIVAGIVSMLCSLITLIPFALSLKQLSKFLFRPGECKLTIQFIGALLVLVNFTLPLLFIREADILYSLFFWSVTSVYMLVAIICIQAYPLPDTLQF